MEKIYSYKTGELESSLADCVKSGVTELSVHDASIADDKGKLLRFLKTVSRDAPELFVSISVNPKNLDADGRTQCESEVSIFCIFAGMKVFFKGQT